MAAAKKITLERRAVVKSLLQERGDALLVTGLGSSTWDAAAAGDDRRNFYLWAAMGGATMIGLGLALAQPKRRVLVITGDGEMLMGLGSLATIGVQQPRNLSIVVLDNEHYAETGMQETHTRSHTDLAAVANATGFKTSTTIYTTRQLATWIPRIYRTRGPILATIKITTRPAPLVLPLKDGVQLKNRFREALLGAKAVD